MRELAVPGADPAVQQQPHEEQQAAADDHHADSDERSVARLVGDTGKGNRGHQHQGDHGKDREPALGLPDVGLGGFGGRKHRAFHLVLCPAQHKTALAFGRQPIHRLVIDQDAHRFAPHRLAARESSRANGRQVFCFVSSATRL